MEQKILTLHPEGKRGVNIGRAKYDLIRAAIIDRLRGRELSASQVLQGVEKAVGPGFPGSVTWYAECVKLDLEAREVIQRLPGSRPQLYRLVDEAR